MGNGSGGCGGGNPGWDRMKKKDTFSAIMKGMLRDLNPGWPESKVPICPHLGGNLGPQRTFVNVWRHFWFSQMGRIDASGKYW